MRSIRRRSEAWLAPLLLLLLFALSPTQSSKFHDPLFYVEVHNRTVVAIADVHADYDTFVALLQQLRVIDSEAKWIANNSVLVQLGDIVDRGSKSKNVMDLLMRLQLEAASQGGVVKALWGNHEFMQFSGTFSYAGDNEFSQWQELETEDEYRKGIDSVFQFLRHHYPALPLSGTLKRILGMSSMSEVTLSRLEHYFRPGYFAHRRLWGPDGLYGRWLLDPSRHPMLIRVNRTLMVHAGLHEQLTFKSIRQLNAEFFSDIHRMLQLLEACVSAGYCHDAFGITGLQHTVWDESRQCAEFCHLPLDIQAIFQATMHILEHSIVFSDRSPLWYRGLCQDHSSRMEQAFNHTLQRYDADFMIVGHTVTHTRKPIWRFQGRLAQLDTGMNQLYYYGFPSAAVLSPQDTRWHFFSAHLPDSHSASA